MRWALALLGFVLGLAAAVAIFGRVDHLRQAVPERLPGWTETLSGLSGPMSGRLHIEAVPGLAGPLQIDWRLIGLAAAGPLWRLRLTGPGLALAGDLAVRAPFREAVLTGGGGTVELAGLTGGLPVQAPDGTLRFDRIDARLRVADRRLLRLEGRGRILGLRHDGVALGDGTFTLAADPGGAWRLSFEIPGGRVAALRGEMSGRLDRVQGGLNAVLVPGPDMPPRWTSGLALLGERRADGSWRLRQRLP